MTRMHVLSILAALLLGALPAAADPAALAPPEQQAMSDTLQYALENNPSDQAADWVNPDTGRAGTVVPTRTFTGAAGQPCREFVTTITIGGQDQQGYGTACRQPDGSWQVVADEAPGSAPPLPSRAFETPPERYYAYPRVLRTRRHLPELRLRLPLRPLLPRPALSRRSVLLGPLSPGVQLPAPCAALVRLPLPASPPLSGPRPALRPGARAARPALRRTPRRAWGVGALTPAGARAFPPFPPQGPLPPAAALSPALPRP